MNIIFQTSRLSFREFTENDVELLYELNSNPNVTKYLHEPAITINDVTILLNETILSEYKLYGYGRWAVHSKSTDEFIGWCGLKFLEKDNEIDLTYRFKENFWGKGYGFEAAKATIDYALNILKLNKIFARALPQNTGSLNILKKCGMNYIGDVLDDDNLMVKKYELIKNN